MSGLSDELLVASFEYPREQSELGSVIYISIKQLLPPTSELGSRFQVESIFYRDDKG